MDKKIVESAIMGFVVGDALGVPVEFKSRYELKKKPVIDMIGYGTYNQPKGTWSDDSSMTLCTLKSLSNGYNLENIMKSFVKWYKEGYMTPFDEVFDIGNTTRDSIENYLKGLDVYVCGGKGQNGSINKNGNGALMRIMPMVLYLYKMYGYTFSENKDALQLICDVNNLTHGHLISMKCCVIYCCIANELICGKNIEVSIKNGILKANTYFENFVKNSKVWDKYFKYIDYDILKCLSENEILSDGYVVDSLVASLWCLIHTDNYKDCVLKAVNLGEDTDTTAAIVGGLAGLYYGVDNIPTDWINTVVKKDYILSLCDDFVEV